MKYTKPAHRLSEVDLKHRRAVCSVCGPTKIYVYKPDKDGVVKQICMNKLRKRSEDYYQDLRKKKGLPELVRKPRHRLSEIDTKKMRAICAVCGLTDIQKSREGKKRTYYVCLTKQKEDSEAYRRKQDIPPRNPSYHQLSQIDDKKKTAVCSRCGHVNIYVSDLGYRIQRRCKNAPREYNERVRQDNHYNSDPK